jgi:CheY-like chemotaxis protein
MQSSRDDSRAEEVSLAVDDGAARLAVLAQDIEPAMADLYEAWLSLDGLRVRRRAVAGEPIALILADLPFPRQDGAARLRQLAQAWPGVPVLALSSTFLPGVAAQGEVARQLGAAAVLAAPVARDTLRHAVAQLLPPRMRPA